MSAEIIIIGSGIAGMTAAIQAVQLGARVTMISPHPSERSQSVMAAGGINAVMEECPGEDSVSSHVEDTYKGGCEIENPADLEYLCSRASQHLRYIEGMGVMFHRDENGRICRRSFGGQSHRRTAYSGSSTGKQIVSALIQKCREYEVSGKITRITGLHFHSALIRDGKCHGVVMLNSMTGKIRPFTADAVIAASGGQNKLFGKTTGTQLCDGYVTGRLFTQGVTLRNLEFIQYHPTTIETPFKKMLISEAARGEGGRLFYEKDGRRCYFMEEKFGPGGNLMPRDIVSKCIYDCPSQVYLDITFLGRECIMERLLEVYDLCSEYMNLDVTRECIPVVPAVHFFMGGIAVDRNHRTNIEGLYAAGECASMYHGANRLGGNSLLAAVHSGRVAAEACAGVKHHGRLNIDDFRDELDRIQKDILNMQTSQSRFPSVYILEDIAELMNRHLGIVRTESELDKGISKISSYIQMISDLEFDPEVSIYENVRVQYLAVLAKAVMLSARERRESRGAHIRKDYPASSDEFRKCSYATYRNGEINIQFR